MTCGSFSVATWANNGLVVTRRQVARSWIGIDEHIRKPWPKTCRDLWLMNDARCYHRMQRVSKHDLSHPQCSANIGEGNFNAHDHIKVYVSHYSTTIPWSNISLCLNWSHSFHELISTIPICIRDPAGNCYPSAPSRTEFPTDLVLTLQYTVMSWTSPHG